MRNRRLEDFKQRLQNLEDIESEFEPSSPAPGPFLLARTAVCRSSAHILSSSLSKSSAVCKVWREAESKPSDCDMFSGSIF